MLNKRVFFFRALQFQEQCEPWFAVIVRIFENNTFSYVTKMAADGYWARKALILSFFKIHKTNLNTYIRGTFGWCNGGTHRTQRWECWRERHRTTMKHWINKTRMMNKVQGKSRQTKLTDRLHSPSISRLAALWAIFKLNISKDWGSSSLNVWRWISHRTYRKIALISPGLVQLRKGFWGVLITGIKKTTLTLVFSLFTHNMLVFKTSSCFTSLQA